MIITAQRPPPACDVGARRKLLRTTMAAGCISLLLGAAAPAPAEAAILTFFGFGFSKNKTYKQIDYWVDQVGKVLGAVGVISPPAASAGATIQTIRTAVRILDPEATSIISGRASFLLDPNSEIVGAGWFGEFGANPLLPAPPVNLSAFDPTQLQLGCNPLMVSCGVSVNQAAGTVVFDFDWGAAGFTPTLNLDPSGHFNFAAVYTIEPPGTNPAFGLVGTNADVIRMGVNAPTYLLCDTGYCGAVPEPSSWLMMIAGLFGAGLVMRRRRPQLRAA